MWFDDLMDDCKRALALVGANIWVALPYVLHTLAVLVCSFILAMFFMVLGVSAWSFSLSSVAEINWVLLVPALLAAIIVMVIIFTALKALVEAGTVPLLAAVAVGQRPSGHIFWEGVRAHFLPMWGISLFLSLMGFLLSPVLIVLAALVVIVGGITAGWGFLLVPIMLTVYLGAWPVALVLDQQGGFSALGAGIQLGNRYFWGMFVLGLAATLLAQSLSTVLGPMGAIFVGWVLASVVQAWTKLTILLIYKRQRPDVAVQQS